MKHTILPTVLLFSLIFSSVKAQSQQTAFHSPVDIPYLMSGSFGEPRPNHFHCGIDVKTQGTVNKRVLAVADGYVSRLTVGKDGFGNAIYITHPNGLVSVYCHLNDFAPALQQLLRKEQYIRQTDEIDIRLSKGVYPVKAGAWIAYSGNTGASLAPHLHMEFQRPTNNGSFVLEDPLPYFQHLAKDDLAPKAHGIKLYSREGAGTINGKGKNIIIEPSHNETTVCNAWGQIGTAIWADDYMNNTSNKFGIYRIVLKVDGKTVFSSEMKSFGYNENPMVNAWGDFPHYKKTRHWYLKSFREPGNKLSFIKTSNNNGWINICDERIYHFEYILEDLKGNRSTYRFNIRGLRNDEALATEKARMAKLRQNPGFLSCNEAHVIQQPGMELQIPLGALSKDDIISVTVKNKPDGHSNQFRLNDEYAPLLKRATLLIAPRYPIDNPKKYYIASSKGFVGNVYKNGWFSAQVRDLAETYELEKDTIPPTVTAIGNWTKRRSTQLKIKVLDKGSGPRTLKALADNTFILFIRDGNMWTCNLNESPLKAGNKTYTLKVVVTDRCDNQKIYEQKFIY